MSEDLKALLEAQKNAILSSVNEKISGLQHSILQKQEDLAAQIEVEEGPVHLKKKGNEQQFKFNSKLLKANAKASRAVESGDLAKAKEALKEGRDLLKERQKLIKLADKSEFGWSTINEYLDDELADDEADARKIKKAEKRAADRIKANQEKKRKSSRVQQPSQGRLPGLNWPASTSSLPYFRPSSSRSSLSRSQDICFRCGKKGHWVENCSRNGSTSNTGSTGK